MGEGDGVYYSGTAYSGSDPAAPTFEPAAFGPAVPGPSVVAFDRSAVRRAKVVRRAKKAAVAVVGLSAVGGGAYFGATLLTGNAPGYVSGGPAALAPVAPTGSPSRPARTKAAPTPFPGPQPGSRSGVRARLSPSPAEPPVSDDEVAAAQVGRLLQASPRPAPSRLTAAGDPVTVTTETGTDGSAIQVVAARYDLAGRWTPADRGRAVGDARCTRNLPAGRDPTPRPRTTMLMCWRTGAHRSVVTVAISRRGRPLDAASLDVLDRQWSALG